MKIPRSNKRGISTVLTTLIIVVASVVLGTAVTLFGTSLFQSGSLQSAISVTNQHLWYDQSSTNSVGGFVVRNTGDKILAVDSITIRGASVPFSSWYYNNTQAAMTSIGELGRNTTTLTTGCTCLDKDNNGSADTKVTVATGPVTLQTGETAMIYYVVPVGKLTASDTGASASVSVFAGSAGSVTTVTVAQVA